MSPRTVTLAVLSCLILGSSGQRQERGWFSNLFNRRPLRDEPQPQACSCTCGERNVDGRIVGGEPAVTNEFPWIVRLSYFNRFYCGGMLINDRYVLTAAHCIKGFMWFMIKVTFGEHDRCDKTAKPETRFVLRAISGDFSFLNFENDVALLRLNDKVPITDTIRPVCLPKTPESLYVGEKAIAAGWGTLEEDGKPACILQEVEVPIMSNDDCKNTNYSEAMISDNMMCAGYKEGLKDSCQGDSGGPLIRERPDKKYELIGVVSWGNGCARPGYPGIYTRVTRYLDWIRSNSADGCWCDDTTKDEDKPTTNKPQRLTTTKHTTESHPTQTAETTDTPNKQPTETPNKQTTETPDKPTTEKDTSSTQDVESSKPTTDKQEELTDQTNITRRNIVQIKINDRVA